MVQKLVEYVGKPFQKGQPLEKLYPAFEAAETFLLTPSRVTNAGPHVRDAVDLKRFMIMVVLAITPCAIFGIYNTGYQSLYAAGLDTSVQSCFYQGLLRYLPLYVMTLFIGGHIELIFAVVRKHEINEGFLVTSFLFPLVLPPTLPLWMAAVGIAFGVIIGKEVFGGTGMNIFNPALTGRAFLFFSYPAQMSGANDVWIAEPVTKIDLSWPFFHTTPLVDAASGATPLLAGSNGTLGDPNAMTMFIGNMPGSIGETSALLALVGAIMLVVMGVGSYKTMLGCVIGALATAAIFNGFSSQMDNPHDLITMSPHLHLLMGGFAFGTAFMATDPVSSPATGTGKWIYGILIGVIAILIRNINPAFPEGMMLAILFMNMFAPLIDHYVMESRIKRRLARA